MKESFTEIFFCIFWYAWVFIGKYFWYTYLSYTLYLCIHYNIKLSNLCPFFTNKFIKCWSAFSMSVCPFQRLNWMNKTRIKLNWHHYCHHYCHHSRTLYNILKQTVLDTHMIMRTKCFEILYVSVGCLLLFCNIKNHHEIKLD